jgi:hypothetical protein
MGAPDLPASGKRRHSLHGHLPGMLDGYNIALIAGACLSAIASLLHVGIIFGGAPWYRFFGAGDRMALAAAAGRIYPTVVTASIALVLALWAAYALAGAGLIPTLPLVKPVLCAITTIYLLRGFAVVPVLAFGRPKSKVFVVWSSVICIAIGMAYLVGLTQVWRAL